MKYLAYFVFCILVASQLAALEITSSAFGKGELIPAKYTCDGENISPALEWSGFPKKTKSFALIVEDPDAPSGTVDHWILYNIPSDVNSLSEAIKDYPKGALGGQNYKGSTAYAGPCPPDKLHRYFFKIYALDTQLNLKEGASKQELLSAMNEHILEQAELIGRYDRINRIKK